MAVLEKIRVKFGLAISIIIALALLSFIVDPGTLQTVFQTMSSKNNVGNIAGKNISYSDFVAEVDRYNTINEIMTGSTVRNEEQNQQIRNAAWQELVDRYLFIRNAKAAGITVGEDEILDLTTGNNISPILAQNPMFANEKGEFSVENVAAFVKNIDSDPSGRVRLYWNYIQNTVYTQQFYAKYGALYNSSSFQNSLQKNYDIAANNTKADVDLVFVPYSFGKDSTINVSSSQAKSYYKKHLEMFKQNASRDIEYVVFEVVPSQEDINAASDAIAAVYDEFGSTGTMKSFLLKNSERQLSEYWYKAGELTTVSKAIDDFVFGEAKGASPVCREGNSFFAARVMKSANIPDSVYVKHILLQGTDAKHLADSLLGVVKAGGNFSATAALYSADQGSMADGEMGNIGWMTQSYMIPGFESVITAEIGKPYIVNTRYGTHIVLVSKKTGPIAKKQVAILEKTALASKETFNGYYSKANKFATLAAGSYEGYKKAVDSLGVYSHQMNVTESTSNYGAIDNAREITRWAFDNKAGKASNIITVNQNYFFVTALKAVHKEGYTPFDEVSDMIGQQLYAKARNAKVKAETAEKIAGIATLEEVASVLGASVNAGQEISFASMGQTMDPAALGAMFVAPIGEIAAPVAGASGVYVFKVNSRDTEAFYTGDDAALLHNQKTQFNSQMILPVMISNADVKDNRARFF